MCCMFNACAFKQELVARSVGKRFRAKRKTKCSFKLCVRKLQRLA